MFTSSLQQSNVHKFHYQLLAHCICTHYSKFGVINIQKCTWLEVIFVDKTISLHWRFLFIWFVTSIYIKSTYK